MATPMLIEGLKRLEYRGYDSAGVAIMNGKGVETRRAAGKIARLESVIAASPPHGTLGIAQTRWATHGPPTENNAHPHVSQNGKIAVVHNGIIENATVLKAGLEARGYVFKSDTDTEVLAHLIETAYAGNLEAAVIEALRQVDGTYGIAVISSDEKDKMVAARKGSPLLVGIGEGENFIASDASAILSHTRHVVYLDDGDIAVVTKDGYRVLDLDSVIREKPVTRIEWDLAQIERGGYPHFMLKEIFEQPTTVENTMRGRL
ncbi:MAG: glutamine--fructose-6-phosphate aminotransferase, partial [Gemmatimonas sp.]